jgi:hypothetical protein
MGQEMKAIQLAYTTLYMQALIGAGDCFGLCLHGQDALCSDKEGGLSQLRRGATADLTSGASRRWLSLICARRPRLQARPGEMARIRDLA